MKYLNISVLLVFVFLVSCENETNNQINTNNDKVSVQVQENFSDSLGILPLINEAHTYYSNKNFEKALETFFKVYELDNKNLHTLINIGNIYYDLNKHTDAIDFYKKALEIDPNNINVRCDLATCIGMSGNPEQAIELLKENVALNSTHAQSHYNMAVFYEKLGKKDESASEMAIYTSLVK